MTFQEIKEKIEKDERNKAYTERGIPPIYQVSEEAKILLIGQAPGKKVEETLTPFNDKSGEKLISWMGIDKRTFYSPSIVIVPMDFYYPGKGRPEIFLRGNSSPKSIIMISLLGCQRFS